MEFTVIHSAQELQELFDRLDFAALESTILTEAERSRREAGRSFWPELFDVSQDGIRQTPRREMAI